MIGRVVILLLALQFRGALCAWEEDADGLVHHIENGQESLDALRTTHFNIVMMYYMTGDDIFDLYRPGYSAAAASIKGESDAPGTPILAAVDCMLDGNTEFCQKNTRWFSPPQFYTFRSHGGEGEILKKRPGVDVGNWLTKYADSSMSKFEAAEWMIDAGQVQHVTTHDFTQLTSAPTAPILVLFHVNWGEQADIMRKSYAGLSNTFAETAGGKLESAKGLVFADVDCSEAKNRWVCKQEDVNPPAPAIRLYGTEADASESIMKHRKIKGGLSSEQLESWLTTQLTGKLPAGKPWGEGGEEDNGQIVHLTADSLPGFNKEQEEREGGSLILFYAPWCGQCDKMKPGFIELSNEYAEHEKAAQATKFGALDCTLWYNRAVCAKYDVTGYPTLVHFEKDKEPFMVKSSRKQAVEAYVNDVSGLLPDPEPWDGDNGEVVHLAERGFEGFRKENPRAIVMFHAPWCGHCKAFKPLFAAASVEASGVAKFAAVDCKTEVAQNLCWRFNVTGYPTILHFDADDASRPVEKYHEPRKAEQLVSYLRVRAGLDEPEDAEVWADTGKVEHFANHQFEAWRGANPTRDLVVMFFSKAKVENIREAWPKYVEASEAIGEEQQLTLALVDCSLQGTMGLCSKSGVRNTPTLVYFPATGASGHEDGEEFEKKQLVEVRYGGGERWYTATVVNRRRVGGGDRSYQTPGQYFVRYEDGGSEKWVAAELIRKMDVQPTVITFNDDLHTVDMKKVFTEFIAAQKAAHAEAGAIIADGGATAAARAAANAPKDEAADEAADGSCGDGGDEGGEAQCTEEAHSEL